jgi:hypothetical protein
MDFIKKVFGKKKKAENNNKIVDFNQSEFDDFVVYSKNEPFKKSVTFISNDIKNIINPNDSTYYRKSFITLENFDESKDASISLDDLMDNILKIINNDLIDFTCKYIYINYSK